MADLNNIIGLEQPLVKLIETIGQGIGVVGNNIFQFDAKRIKRVGKAEAEVEKIKLIKKTEGEAEAFGTLERASTRFVGDQYDRQINLENIVVKTRKLLEGQAVNDVPVEKDWSSRFVNVAQEVSREEVQDILAKILAGEIREPGAFSLRTLNFIKNLDKETILNFKKISSLSFDNDIVYLIKDTANRGFFDIKFDELMFLIEVGLIQSNLTTIVEIGNDEEQISLTMKSGKKSYTYFPSEGKEVFELPVIRLSTMAKEIAPLIEYTRSEKIRKNKYALELQKFWKSKGIREELS